MSRRKHKKKAHGEVKRASLFDLHPETKKGVIAVLFIALAAVTMLAHAERSGPAGAYLVQGTRFLFGVGAYLLPLVFLGVAVAFLKSWGRHIYATTLVGAGLFLLSVLGAVELFTGHVKRGGVVGAAIAVPVEGIFGYWGALVIFCALVLVGVLVLFNAPLQIFGFGERGWARQEAVPAMKPMQPIAVDAEPAGVKIWTDKAASEPPKALGQLWNKVFARPKFKTNAIGDDEAKKIKEVGEPPSVMEKKLEPKEEFMATMRDGSTPYEPPPIDILEEDRGVPSSGDIKANVNVIKRTLSNFGIEVEMGEVSVGPSVTQYTLKPAEGIKLSRIHGLQNDLALALAAYPLRIEAPIPGRSLVGIEIPNRTTTLVRLRNLILHEKFQSSFARLLLALGRDVTGEAMFTDLAKMPHLLIAGSTGAGKSVCMHSVIASFLYRNTPRDLQFIFIDPKRVELSVYNGIPHLLHPVIVDGKKAILALKWAVREMEHRYELLSEVHARDIASYNETVSGKKHRDHKPIPYIVVVIDELADLMAAYARDVESAIVRLAQMARAVGIHLLVSTQRPSIDVITGLIKANITGRIAFQMASQVDSRTVLDMAGAEKLLGNGDMLFLAGDASKPKRIQGAFVTEREVKKLADHLRKFSSTGEEEEVIDLERAAHDSNFALGVDAGDDGGDDTLYEEAVGVVREAKKASASLLQRRLRVGYARAARLLDILEDRGIIGPGEGAKPRVVYGVEGGAGEEPKEDDFV